MKHNNFKQRVLTLALAAVLAIGGGFFAVNSFAASVGGVTNAKVVIPIAVANDTTLDFGTFTNVANTIAVSPANVRSATASNSLLTVYPSTAGQVTVTGEGVATYSIALTPAALSGPSEATMVLSLMTCADAGLTGDLITSGTLVGGTQMLKIGATLTVSASQTAGDYTGTYDVTVEYN